MRSSRSLYPQRDWPDRLRRVGLFWLAGIVVSGASIAVAAILFQLGYFVIAIIAAVLVALTLLPFSFLAMRNRKNRNDDSDFNWVGIVSLIGMLVAVAVSLVGQDEVVLFGATARNVVAAEAGGSDAAFVHFRDARVLNDRMARIPVWAGSQRAGSHVAYYVRVAPIVDADWTPSRPIAAFAVLGSPNMGHYNADWREAWNGGIRSNGANAAEREQALQQFRHDPDLQVAATPIFLRWSANPEGDAAAAWARLYTAFLIAAGIWTAMTVFGFLFSA